LRRCFARGMAWFEQRSGRHVYIKTKTYIDVHARVPIHLYISGFRVGFRLGSILANVRICSPTGRRPAGGQIWTLS
jgi:hypothetical protein